MLPPDFEFHAPTTLDEALEVLNLREEARVLGGGMSLLPLINLGERTASDLVSLRRIPGLRIIEQVGDGIRIGGSATHHQIASDPTVQRECPVLADAAGKIADVQVRNRGTIGGSLSHGYPGAEYLTVLSALGGRATLRSVNGERIVPVRDIALGRLHTVVRTDEVLTDVYVPSTPSDTQAAYIRFARVMGNYSTVNVVAAVRRDRSVTFGLGGAMLTPIVFEAGLDDDIEALARNACGESYDDHMATADYRIAMAGVLARRSIDIALADTPRAERS